jgi:hypothetical protein
MFEADNPQLTGTPIDDWKLQLQANQILNVSSRITRAMVEIALQSMQMQTCISVLKLEQAVETKCYPEFSTIWSQFDAIGQKHSTTLFGHVKTIQQLKSFDYFQIECLIGKATAHKLKDSVSKLPIFVPRLLSVRFVGRHFVSQDCKWEIQMEIQRSYTPNECRVNILAGLWHGTASMVKRHYLLQESGPANSMTFMVTSTSNDRYLIIHLAVLSCTHAGLDREIFYKCAIDSVDANTHLAGRIDEINEKTLEVLARKKTDIHELKDSMEEVKGDDRFDASQSTQAKKKPKMIATKDRDEMNTDETFNLTEKQLGLLPNKTLKTVTAIKKKQAEPQLEFSDDENYFEFQKEQFEQELFKQMDCPKSTEQDFEGLTYECNEELQHCDEVHSAKVGMIDDLQNCAHLQKIEKSTPNHIQMNFSVSSKKSSPIKLNLSQRPNLSNEKERLRFQFAIQEPIRCESSNPFASFAYNPKQNDCTVLKNSEPLENKAVPITFDNSSEQPATFLPKSKFFDTDRSIPETSLQGMFPYSQISRFEGRPRHNKTCEMIGTSIQTRSINEPVLHTTHNAGLVQVYS